MTATIDLFLFYRSLLFLVLTVYTTVMMISILSESWWLVTSRDRIAVMLRKYIVVLVLRQRLGPLGRQLLEILVLAVAFGGLMWLHRVWPLPGSPTEP